MCGYVKQDALGLVQNSAAIMGDGKLIGTTSKFFLPTYGLFEELRYFVPGNPKTDLRVFESDKCRFGVIICEDAWHPEPIQALARLGAEIIFCLASSPARGIGKSEPGGELPIESQWLSLLKAHALMSNVFIAFVNRVGPEDDEFFWGGSTVVSPAGEITGQGKEGRDRLGHRRHRPGRGEEGEEILVVQRLQSRVSRGAARPMTPELEEIVPQSYSINTARVTDYLARRLALYVNEYAGRTKAIVGLSGGVDSAVVAYLSTKAVGPENTHLYLLPSSSTPNEDMEDAKAVVEMLRVPKDNCRLVSIDKHTTELASSLGKRQDRLTVANIKARVRMILLHGFAGVLGWPGGRDRRQVGNHDRVLHEVRRRRRGSCSR